MQNSNAILEARIAQLTAELATMKEANKRSIKFKVSEKGAVSVYGLNARFPVTLYAGQWAKLFEAGPALQQFIQENMPKLAQKSA
jgi:hypothetical protein